ncbi:hypothetical protein [Aliterella atlantica]|uniref:Uncharacterized protein n=1 Tax=Aliterella atlantica CENA595 TaxID=1618023 RepID=A0A0D8ZP63_9CYAN|nr:hypothetical protein UH38_19110 [Aliterella atlantica CENA595]
MSNFRIAIRSARSFLKRCSPAYLNVEINRDLLKNFTALFSPEPKLLPPVADSSLRGRPHWRRITQVFQILDEATKDGMVSYPTLINCVREATGKGCSRKLISKWKLERGLR